MSLAVLVDALKGASINGVRLALRDRQLAREYLAQSMQRFFRDARAMKAQNRFFGGMLMLMGGALFFVKRT